MSIETRQLVVHNAKFQDEIAKADLLDPTRVSTYVIAMLLEIQAAIAPAELLITSVRGDHGPDPAGSVHGHEEGWAVDVWADDIEALLVAAAGSRYCWTIGVGGAAKEARCPHLSPNQVFFDDNDQDHVHLQSGNAYGEGDRSAA